MLHKLYCHVSRHVESDSETTADRSTGAEEKYVRQVDTIVQMKRTDVVIVYGDEMLILWIWTESWLLR